MEKKFKINEAVTVEGILFHVVSTNEDVVLLRLAHASDYPRAKAAKYHSRPNFWAMFQLHIYEDRDDSPATSIVKDYCLITGIAFKKVQYDYYVWCKPDYINIDPLTWLQERMRDEIKGDTK